MKGVLSRWILRGVLKSALAFETEALSTYTKLRQRLGTGRSCSDDLDASLCHLIEEEDSHRRILMDAAEGKLSLEELQAMLDRHLYEGFDRIRPLTGETLREWEADLSAALEQEEKTWIFYGNLRRMSKIPTVKKAFEALASMEKEHLDILRRLLDRSER
ncbi:MAG TPA: ferritin family protein [Spirochaetia bacterium]|nr:ferritin family protein [Spirochaetia bacterium]